MRFTTLPQCKPCWERYWLVENGGAQDAGAGGGSVVCMVVRAQSSTSKGGGSRLVAEYRLDMKQLFEWGSMQQGDNNGCACI